MSRFCILMYHMINEPGSRAEARYACPPARFASHLRALKRAGYAAVTPSEVELHLAGSRRLPEKAVLISIDDGFRDNYEHAWPLLREAGMPAIIFLATSHIGGHNAWMAGDEYPERPMLGWDQVREMQSEGIHFGGHTMNHARLSSLSHDQALEELAGCHERLKAELGEAPGWFAYPYGDLDERTPQIVRKAGFDFACTTRSGFNNTDAAPLLLRRLEVYGNDTPRTLLRKIRFGSNDVSTAALARYYLGRIATRLRPGAA